MKITESRLRRLIRQVIVEGTENYVVLSDKQLAKIFRLRELQRQGVLVPEDALTNIKNKVCDSNMGFEENGGLEIAEKNIGWLKISARDNAENFINYDTNAKRYASDYDLHLLDVRRENEMLNQARSRGYK